MRTLIVGRVIGGKHGVGTTRRSANGTLYLTEAEAATVPWITGNLRHYLPRPARTGMRKLAGSHLPGSRAAAWPGSVRCRKSP